MAFADQSRVPRNLRAMRDGLSLARICSSDRTERCRRAMIRSVVASLAGCKGSGTATRLLQSLYRNPELHRRHAGSCNLQIGALASIGTLAGGVVPEQACTALEPLGTPLQTAHRSHPLPPARNYRTHDPTVSALTHSSSRKGRKRPEIAKRFLQGLWLGPRRRRTHSASSCKPQTDPFPSIGLMSRSVALDVPCTAPKPLGNLLQTAHRSCHWAATDLSCRWIQFRQPSGKRQMVRRIHTGTPQRLSLHSMM